MVKVRRISRKFIVEPLPKGRNVLLNLIKANGYTVIPSGAALKKGEQVEVSIFDMKGLTDPYTLLGQKPRGGYKDTIQERSLDLLD